MSGQFPDNESNSRRKHHLGLLSFRLLYHTHSYQQTMGYSDTRIHYLDRINSSTYPHNPTNIKLGKREEAAIFYYYLDNLDKSGSTEEFNLEFLL